MYVSKNDSQTCIFTGVAATLRLCCVCMRVCVVYNNSVLNRIFDCDEKPLKSNWFHSSVAWQCTGL